jgi:transposase
MKKPKAVPPQVKFQAALEAIKGEKSLVELARIYNVHPNTIVKWKAELMEKGATLFSNETQEKELEKKIRDLEQLIGKKEVGWTYAASTCTGNRGLKSRLSLPAMSLRRHW